MMDEFIQFLARYDSSYPQSIEGAPVEMISRLSELVGRPIPPRYEEFLRHMGRSLGNFTVPNVNFDIEQIIEFFESEEWRPPERYVLVAMETQDPYFDYYLDLERPVDSDFGVVRFESWGTTASEGRVHPWFHSFRDMLFSLGFLHKRVGLLPCQTELLPSPAKEQRTGQSQRELVKAMEDLARRMGFQRLPHTSPSCLLLDREDAALYGHLPPQGGFIAKAAATDKGQLSKICEILRDHTIFT